MAAVSGRVQKRRQPRSAPWWGEGHAGVCPATNVATQWRQRRAYGRRALVLALEDEFPSRCARHSSIWRFSDRAAVRRTLRNFIVSPFVMKIWPRRSWVPANHGPRAESLLGRSHARCGASGFGPWL